MHISEFDFDLPDELIAQEPIEPRDGSRMLVVDRKSRSYRDGQFVEFPDLFNPGDVIVINNTRVFPARLIGHRLINGQPGAQIEVFLVKPVQNQDGATAKIEWEVLAKPGRAMKIGSELEFGNGRLRGLITDIAEDGKRLIRFECDEDFNLVIDEIGNTPLPPYIKRQVSEERRLDETRYQTVYAKQRGAIAAPTAGLHFTERIFDRLRARGVEIVEITHHVGYATFQPVRVEQIEEHQIAAESYEVSESAADIINQARRADNRVLAVGTTSVRALESAANPDRTVRAEHTSTELFIYPGYRFRMVDALLTNFHLPQSSLLMLVSAFADKDLILRAYRHAVERRYRFYSYGDCMLVI